MLPPFSERIEKASPSERTARWGFRKEGARSSERFIPLRSRRKALRLNADVDWPRTAKSRHVACASSCISMRTSLEEGIKLHRFAGIFPEQFFTEAGRHREAVVAADQRKVIRCFRDDLAGFVHDVSHVPPPIQRAGLVDAPFWRHHEGRDRQLDAAEHLKGMA